MRVVGVIVPDVHERYPKLLRIEERFEAADWFIFLGDFMDSFDDFTENTVLIVEWLKKNLSNPKYKFIWGNHDLHYAYPIEGLVCSGWDRRKASLTKAQLTEIHWMNFKLFEMITLPGTTTEYLCSHAGLHPHFLHPIHGFSMTHLQDQAERAMERVKHEQVVNPLLEIGPGRGGRWARARVGGIIWLDWQSEFTPIDGLNQIVGHSPMDHVRRKGYQPSTRGPKHTWLLGSDNICVDTHLNHVVLIMEDGTLKIEDISEL